MVANSHRTASASAAERNGKSSFGAVLHDVTELVELQCQLIALNSREAKATAMRAVMLGTLASGLFAVAALFSLGAVALALYEYTELRMWSAFAIVGVGSLVLSAALGWGASAALKHCGTAWRASKQELAENVRWLKRSLSGQSSPPAQNGSDTDSSRYQPNYEQVR